MNSWKIRYSFAIVVISFDLVTFLSKFERLTIISACTNLAKIHFFAIFSRETCLLNLPAGSESDK